MTRIQHKPTTTAGLALVALVALAVSGCASSASLDYLRVTPELPDSWIGASNEPSADAPQPTAEDLATWWQQLGDPVLDQLVARTVSGNLDLQTAAARVAEARARRGLARADLGPSISASLGVGRSEPLGDGSGVDSYSASLDTAWEADLFGANRLSVAASQADLETSIEDLHAARVALVAETVVAYADLRVAEARLRVVDESVESREQTFQLTDWRQQAGLASRLEVSQAASNLEQTRAGTPTLERAATEARLRLALLAGELPGAFDELLATKEATGMPEPPAAVAPNIPAEVLRQRPDVRAAEHGLDAALARLGVAEAARYPTLRLSGSLDTQTRSAEDLLDADSMLSNLLAGLTAPIFESGRIRDNIAIREAQAEQAALAYRGTVLEALSEVEAALEAFQRTRDRIAALEDAIRAAEEAEQLASQRYAAGLADLLSVLDTQRTLLSLEEQWVIARGESVSAFSSLYRALGGGWHDLPQTPATPGESNV